RERDRSGGRGHRQLLELRAGGGSLTDVHDDVVASLLGVDRRDGGALEGGGDGLADLRLGGPGRCGRGAVHLDHQGGQLGGEVGGDVGRPVDVGDCAEHLVGGGLDGLAVHTADDDLEAAAET